MVKNLPANAGDMGSIPGLGKSPRGGNGNPLQYSCLEIPWIEGAWQAKLDTTCMHVLDIAAAALKKRKANTAY